MQGAAIQTRYRGSPLVPASICECTNFLDHRFVSINYREIGPFQSTLWRGIEER
jgi:hypothetical protein